jgi:peptidoglycan/LPS O-acetylase OafA/YrhL
VAVGWDWLAAFFAVSDVLGIPFPLGPLWSMEPMFQFYGLWIVGFWLVRRRFLAADRGDVHRATLGVMRGVTAAVVALSAAAYSFATSTDPNAHWVWELPTSAWLIGAGMLVYWAATRQVSTRWAVVLAVGCVLANVVLYLRTGRVEGHTTWGYKAVLAGGVLFAIGRGYRFPDRLLFRLLGRVGRWSFSIYLTHTLTGPKVFWAVERLFHPAPVWALAIYVFAFAAILGGAYVFYTLVEAPVARYCERYRYRGTRVRQRSDHTPPLGLVLPVSR